MTSMEGVHMKQEKIGNLDLGSIQIPINACTKTFGILAKRGAGKSYTAGVMMEEFYKLGIPFVVFDPIDIYWGLKLNKDGKSKGIPVVVFGIEHEDIKIDRNMGRRIAQSIVRHNVSCVVSTFGMPKVGQRHLMAEFAEELLNINDTPRHVFIEEAHEFVPQRVFGQLGKTFNAVSNLVVMGRNRGIGVTLINQRAATINKDVLTQIDTLLAFRNIAPQDRKALREWVEYHAAEGDFEKFMDSLPSLPTGEGWIWSPEFLGIFKKIKIRERRTFHPDREKLGNQFTMPHLDQVDIQDFIDAFQESSTPKVEEEKKEIEVKKDSMELVALRNTYESKLMQKDIEIRQLRAIIDSIRRLTSYQTTSELADLTGKEKILQHKSFEDLSVVPGNVGMWISKLGNGGASRILKFLSEKSGMKFTRSQIALAVGMSSKGGSFITYLSTLKRNSLILREGEFIKINPDL